MRNRLSWISCATFCLLLGTAASGQTTSKPAETHKGSQKAPHTPAEHAPVPEPLASEPLSISFGPETQVPIAEIIPRAEDAMEQFRDIQAKAANTSDIVTAQQTLPQMTRNIDASLQSTLATIQRSQSAQYLQETRVVWERRKQQLDAWNTSVGKQITFLSEKGEFLRQQMQEWTTAQKSADEVKLREDLQKKIQEAQAATAQTEGVVRQSLDSLVNLQVNVAEQRQRVNSVLEAIGVAEEALRQQIFVVESPPLWKIFSKGVGDWGLWWRSLRINGASERFVEFYRVERDQLIVYLLFVVILFFALLHLKQTRDREPKNAGEENKAGGFPVDFIDHPFITTAFLALLLFGFAFKRAPAELLSLDHLLLIIPTYLVLKQIFPRELHRPLLVLAALYAFDLVSSQATAGTIPRRLLVLAISVFGTGWFALVLRQKSPASEFFRERGWNGFLVFGRLAQFALIVSFFMNLIGNVSLADYLAVGTLVAMYSGVLIYATTLLLNALAEAAVHTEIARKLRVVRFHRDTLLKTTSKILKYVGWFIWASAILDGFQIFRPAISGVEEIIGRSWKLGAVSISIGDVLMFVLVLVASNLVARTIRFLLEEEIFPRTGLSSGVAGAGSRLVYYFLVSLGLFLALGASGLDLGKLTILTGAFGVGLGFGLQNLVSNFVSGIILLLERPMQVGDVIEVEKLMGTVAEIGFRSSTVRTFDGSEVIVPNSDFITKSFVNWTLTDRMRRMEIAVGVAYGTDINKTMLLLREVVGKTQDVLEFPQPQVIFDGFGESSLNLLVRYWTKLDFVVTTKSDLSVGILNALNEAGIQIPFPQRDLHIKTEDATAMGEKLRAALQKGGTSGQE